MTRRTVGHEIADPQHFDGLRAIVTGGASGIGLATARRLAAGGAQVGLLDLAASGPAQFLFAQASIADDNAVRSGVSALTGAMGGLDILVNNAGIGAQGGVEENDDAEWARVLDVNVTGLARVSRAALPLLRRSAEPAIVTSARSPPPWACRSAPSTPRARARCCRSPSRWPPTCWPKASG